MRRGSQSKTIIAPKANHGLNVVDYMYVDMENKEVNNGNQEGTSKPQKTFSRRAENLRQGYLAYLKELPELLKDDHEGHQVAYLADQRIGIAPTKREIYEELERVPKFSKKLKDILIQRVTVLDAEEHGIRVKKPRSR